MDDLLDEIKFALAVPVVRDEVRTETLSCDPMPVESIGFERSDRFAEIALRGVGTELEVRAAIGRQAIEEPLRVDRYRCRLEERHKDPRAYFGCDPK
ncbi:hypothetical protein [Natronomonas sp.]|uniref:hypothetical protein n=1 Tax=Natronomonas sp. TaxID=2184060 RepID=UPI0039759B49